MRRKLIYFCTALLCVLMASCHGKKAKVAETVSPGEYYPMPAVYDALASGYEKWGDVYMPVSVSISEPVDFSISGRATLVCDSLIHISLRVLGIEAGVISIGADSAVIIDKYHKMYVSESTSAFLGSHTLTIGELQSVLLGQAYAGGSSRIQACVSDSQPPVLQAIDFMSRDDLKLSVAFSDFCEVPAGIAASKVAFDGRVPGKSVSASLQWNFGRAEWNTGRRPTLKMPGSGYKRIELTTILANMAKTNL